MSGTVLEYQGVLVVVRCWCGLQHTVPESLRDLQKRQFDDGKDPQCIYCPLGHQHVPAGKTEVDRLRSQLAMKDNTIAFVRSQHDQTKAELRETESRRRAEKAAKTKLKKRIANGVCPCCSRHFTNLERHIAHMHPDFALETKTNSVGD